MQILKANTKKKASSQGGGSAHPLYPRPKSTPAYGFILTERSNLSVNEERGYVSEENVNWPP